MSQVNMQFSEIKFQDISQRIKFIASLLTWYEYIRVQTNEQLHKCLEVIFFFILHSH